jgi:hypothetical protein
VGEIHIGRESLAAARAGAESVERLLLRHWEEIAHFQDIPLDVDWPVYEAAERAGKLRIFTVRDDRELVGYAVYTLGQAPHYRGSLQAIQDVLFLAPEYRRGTAGIELVAYADTMLKAEGAQVTYQHSKVRNPIDMILRRQRYELVERIFAKRHDRERD